MSKTSQALCNPKECLGLSFIRSVDIIKNIIGEKNFERAKDISHNYPSPVSSFKDSSWAKALKITGINPIITKSFWGIVKYALSCAECGIHIMPLFETGDGSLYVQNSWNISDDFYDKDLETLGFYSKEEQLKFTVNILHAMGKVVGFDVSLHVDNFSKITLLNPRYFEWVKLTKDKTSQITPYDYDNIHFEIEKIIIETLNLPKNIFELEEKEREKLIFPKDKDEFQIRMLLRKNIREEGYEPIPVTEHKPMRPLIFDRMEKSNTDSWAVFRVENKNPAAKIIGSVTPYKLYSTDKYGYPIKNAIYEDVWEYVSDKIFEFQKTYNFDFLRADMAHNQTSHSHKEDEKDINSPELWAYIKAKIKTKVPYFMTFAESFYSTYYIDGFSDMINKDFDIILGDLNFKHPGSEFLNCIEDYLNPFRENFPFYPCATVYTNDCDLEINNKYYKNNKENLLRYFISMFLNLPSYTAIGYELRDIEPEQYSNYYTKKQKQDYTFGNNIELLRGIQEIREVYKKLKNIIESKNLNLIYAKNNSQSLCFCYENFLIVSNFNCNINNIELNIADRNISLYYSPYQVIISKNKDNVNINIDGFEFAILNIT